MKLYAFWRSSCSYRARIALGLKGLPFEIVPVALRADHQKTDEFTAKNPSQQVPVLQLDDGTQLGQSIAIMEYLEEVFPEPPLLPHEPVARARCRQLVEVVNSGIQPQQNLYVLERLKREHGVDAKAWAVHHIRRGLLAYERLVEHTAGTLSMGETPTLADCLLVPQVFNARGMGIDVATEMPRIERIDRACQAIEAFAAAHPDRQPDANSG